MMLERFISWCRLAPLLLILLFTGFCLRATLALGRLPTPYQPDPKDLDFDIHHSAIALLGYTTVWFFIPVVVLYDGYALFTGKIKRQKIHLSRIWILVFPLIWWLNPLDLVNWFLD